MPDPMIIETKMSDGNTYVWVQVTPGLTERMKAYLAGRRVRHGAVKLTKQEWHDAPKMTEAWQKRKFVPREGIERVAKKSGKTGCVLPI